MATRIAMDWAVEAATRKISKALNKNLNWVRAQFEAAWKYESVMRLDQLGLNVARHNQLSELIRKHDPYARKQVIFRRAMVAQVNERYP